MKFWRDYEQDDYPQWRVIGVISGLIWTIALAISLTWNIYEVDRGILDIAINNAQVAYEKDMTYRRWNSQFGGVYVPLSSGVLPNPYLEDFPGRDITSTTGEEFTLVNPAYMTRQVHELENEQGFVFGHLTSLDPIRPENTPDEWESEALKQFELGAVEISSVEIMGGAEHMRLMRPMYVEKSCIVCHEEQNREGIVRGGISVSVPMADLRRIEKNQIVVLMVAHIFIWSSGVLGIRWASRRLRETDSLRSRDPYLRCFNRHYFFQFLEVEVARSIRYDAPLSVIMLDIDHFKRINDTYGHLTGDEILKGFVSRVQAQLREADVFARYGGDEFSILLPETEVEAAANLAERLRDDIENYVYTADDLKIILTSSLGVSSLYGRRALDSSLLVKEADQALYRAKGMGRNRVEVWDWDQRNRLVE